MTDLQMRVRRGLGSDWNAALSPWEGLMRLYESDREAFYHLVGNDPRYEAGWSTAGSDTRQTYLGLEDDVQNSVRNARYATTALYFNHVLSALDALRAARFNNIPLQRNLRIRLRGSMGSKGEAMTVILERKF